MPARKPLETLETSDVGTIVPRDPTFGQDQFGPGELVLGRRTIAELLAERPQLLTPAEVGVLLAVSPITIREWITAGLFLPNRKRVRLAARRIGGRWKVAPEAVEAFERACTEAALPPAEPDGPPVPCPTPGATRRLNAAMAELDVMYGRTPAKPVKKGAADVRKKPR